MTAILKERLSRWLDRRSADLAALGVIGLFFFICFGSYIWNGQYLIGGDVFFYTHPLRSVAWEMIRSGSLPLWTPHVMSGYPLLAMAQLGLAYPLTWGYLVLPHQVAEQIYVLAPFLLAPSFTYAYLRELGRSHMAALLAALSFGYGGLMTNTYGMNAVPTNALMWLPLLLIVVERARQRRLIPCLISATLIYSLSVLTGHGQSFMQVGVLALAYALFVSFSCTSKVLGETVSRERRPLRWARWRPVFVTAGAMVFSAGLAAFQILETMRAAYNSIRSYISYEFFSAGGFTPTEALRSFLVPLVHYTEVTTYQAPFIVLLASTSVALGIRRQPIPDRRVYFWLVVAIGAWILLLGGNSPLYRVLYHVPIFNQFRRPSRYAFEWTFAISVLAAYGWDAANALIGARTKVTKKRLKIHTWTSAFALLICTALAWGWWRAVLHSAGEAYYLRWKFAFTILTTLVVVYAGLFLMPTWRNRVTAIALLLVCLVEPFILIKHWWPGTAKTSARLVTPASTTSWLLRFPQTEHRVYVRVNGADEESSTRPRFDALDRTALFGLHNVGGYEPLFLERYSRALGGVDFDGINPRPGFAATNQLLDSRSHVLDLLNTSFVVVWPNLQITPETDVVVHGGVPFAGRDLRIDLKPGEIVSVGGGGAMGNTIMVVTSLANSTTLAQGTAVARLRIYTTKGHIIERELLAGVDTSEWAHERPDVRSGIKHELSPVFDSRPGDTNNTFVALRYIARVPLGESVAVDRIAVVNISQSASLAFWKATVYGDSIDGQATPLINEPDATQIDATRWQSEKDFDGVRVLRNKRALPRAWLVAEVKAVNGEEALHQIQGDTEREFDPRRTALLEVPPNELPVLSGGLMNTDSTARIITYEPSRLIIETKAPTASVLVLSEIFYPGWEATVDGQSSRIFPADFLLRGVALSAGPHRVEMRYTAPAGRVGVLISISTILLLTILIVFERARRHDA